jgi:hypothetical protein
MEPLLIKSRRPEDAELSRKQKELAELQSRLADLELQLLTLRLELAEFDKLYHSRVGPLYAELDEVEALIAENLARDKPLDDNVVEFATEARKRADDSRQTVADGPQTVPNPVTRSEKLRDLYRTVAKTLHPDLSQDNGDHIIRERLMTEANLAYARGDENGLRAILDEYEGSPDSVLGNDVAADLIRTIRRISLANRRSKEIEDEVQRLEGSETYKLKTTVEEGSRKGTDVLGELVETLKQRIRAKREILGACEHPNAG